MPTKQCGSEKRQEQAKSNILAAKSNGYDKNKKPDLGEDFDVDSIKNQDSVFNRFVDWYWDDEGQIRDIADVEKEVLRKGAPAPSEEQLQKFWEFYHASGKGRLENLPTHASLISKAKAFNGGWKRRTGISMPAELISAVRKHINRMTKSTRNPKGAVSAKKRPKYNFKIKDLDRILAALWVEQDTIPIRDREKVQFQWLLILYTWSGARIGAFFDGGALKYKDFTLVLRRINGEGEWELIEKLDQRYTKNNLHPEDIAHSMGEKSSKTLRYNDGFLLLLMAITDGALYEVKSLKQLFDKRIPAGYDKVELLWEGGAKDLPVARAIVNGHVSPNKPWTLRRFTAIFEAKLQEACYVGIRPQVHQVRRELMSKLNRRYTPDERSQHVLHFDNRIFGASYMGNISSCDGGAAFRQEAPDHSVAEYFQGIGQFREPGLPVTLPVSMKRSLRKDPQVVELQSRADAATDKAERKEALYKKQMLLRKLEGASLVSYQASWHLQRKKDKILGKDRTTLLTEREPNVLNEIVPEKGRIAHLMSRTQALTAGELLVAMEDLLSLLLADGRVFYRPGENPVDGRCPECQREMTEFPERRRCDHIRECLRKAKAKTLPVLPSWLEYCWYCFEWFEAGKQWEAHCNDHLSRPLPKRCAALIYRNTVVRPAFCVFCRQCDGKPSQRMFHCDNDQKLLRHIEEQHPLPQPCLECGVQKADHDHLQQVHEYKVRSCSRMVLIKGDSTGLLSLEASPAPNSSTDVGQSSSDVEDTKTRLQSHQVLSGRKPLPTCRPKNAGLQADNDANLNASAVRSASPSSFSVVSTDLASGLAASEFEEKFFMDLTISDDEEVGSPGTGSGPILPTFCNEASPVDSKSAQLFNLSLMAGEALGRIEAACGASGLGTQPQVAESGGSFLAVTSPGKADAQVCALAAGSDSIDLDAASPSTTGEDDPFRANGQVKIKLVKKQNPITIKLVSQKRGSAAIDRGDCKPKRIKLLLRA